MYAVIAAGGKQHRVEKGEVLRLEKIDAAEGDSVDFAEVLLVGAGAEVAIGSPKVSGAKVVAEVVKHGRADKVKIIKFRRRKHSMKRQGHRQWFTEVKITDIIASGAKPATKAAKNAVASKTEKAAKPAPSKASGAGADDLTRISGVGPVLVKKLAAAGVTSFAQIAAWTDQDVAEFDDKLNFKGRIERDGWIEQAKKFMSGE